MKCVNCRRRLPKNTTICPNCAFDMSDYIQEAASASKLPRILLGVALVAAVGGAGALYCSGILTPANVTVAAALTSTVHTLSQEVDDFLVRPLPAHLSQLPQGQSSLALAGDIAPSAVVTLDFERTQFSADFSLFGTSATAYLFPQSAILSLDSAQRVVGVDLVHLTDDLPTSPLAASFDVDAIASAYRTDILENVNQIHTTCIDLLSQHLLPLVSQVEVTQLGTEVVEVNGQSLSTTAYALSLDADEVEPAIYALVDDLFESPVLSPYMALIAHQQGLTPESLQALLTTPLSLTLDSYLRLDDRTFTVNLYEGRVVRLSTLLDGQGYALDLNPTGNILEYLSLLRLDGTQTSPCTSLSFVQEGGLLNGIFAQADGSILCSIQGSCDSLTLSMRDSPVLVASMDSSTPDLLHVELPQEGLYLQSTIISLDEDWFSPPDYENVLTMSQTELFLLSTALTY